MDTGGWGIMGVEVEVGGWSILDGFLFFLSQEVRPCILHPNSSTFSSPLLGPFLLSPTLPLGESQKHCLGHSKFGWVECDDLDKLKCFHETPHLDSVVTNHCLQLTGLLCDGILYIALCGEQNASLDLGKLLTRTMITQSWSRRFLEMLSMIAVMVIYSGFCILWLSTTPSCGEEMTISECSTHSM